MWYISAAMRIFVLGAGASGSLLAQLLARQGHTVWSGDRDLTRARRFLGKRSPIPVHEVNARNLWAVVRAARGCHLLVNAAQPVFNEIVMRAALRVRAHYLDLASHLSRHPFKAEELRYNQRFEKRNRAALMNAGAAPGLTNLLVKRGAEMLDAVESAHIYLYEHTESDDPISQWSAEEAFNEAVAHPRVYCDGRFKFAKKFDGREVFQFPPPIGGAPVYLAAQDEIATVPRFITMREMTAKIGGDDIERLRRLYRQGKLSRSRGRVSHRFPDTLHPRAVAKLIRKGVLQNARFAAAVIVRGMKQTKKEEQRLEIRWDVEFPSLYQLRQRGFLGTPVTYGTAHIAALFVKNFDRELAGVFPPEDLPVEMRRAILDDLRSRDINVRMRIKKLKPLDDDELEM